MRTIHALFAFAFVFSIVVLNRQNARADQEPQKEGAVEQPCADGAPSEEVVEIPLKDIWALNMPGTRDAHKLEPEAYGPQVKSLSPQAHLDRVLGSLSNQIWKALDNSDIQDAGKAFVVESVDREALKAAVARLKSRDKLGNEQGKIDRLLADVPATLFFYARPSGLRVRLTSAMRTKRQIVLRFQIIWTPQKELTQHYALIPLGKLPVGDYQVEIDFEPTLAQQKDARRLKRFREWREQLVCQSFSFEILEAGHGRRGSSSNH